MYIKQMDDVIYNEMADEARIAVRLLDAIDIDKNGSIVSEDNTSLVAFGLPTNMELVFPEYLLFAEETGCNTNQQKDGHIAGTKFLVQRGTTPKIQCATSDHHFTVLGFTAAMGEPVLCVIIFAGEGGAVPA